MNMRICFLNMITLLLIFSGCTPSESGRIDAEPSITVTAIPVTETWTVTPIEPTHTATPSPTKPERTPSPTSSGTPTLEIPILSQEERAERIQQLFADNDECKFPCWWGVVPGITDTHAALQHISSYFGEMPHVFTTEKKSTIYYYTILDELDIRTIHSGLYEVNNKINHMRLYVDKPSRIEGFSTFLNSLKVDQILTTYGVPSRVLFYYHPPVEPNSVGGAYLWIVYEQPPGFIIEYSIDEPPMPKLCPLSPDNYRLEYIIVYLGALDQHEFPLVYGYAEQLDVEEFYYQLSSPNECMILPEEVWR
jgi:hypothetical protein